MNKAKKHLLAQVQIVQMLRRNTSLILVIILIASVITPLGVSANSDLLPIQVKPIANSEFTSFFILTDGSLYACGYNAYGQLGDGTYRDRSVPVKILDNVVFVEDGFNKNYAITKYGDLYVWGSSDWLDEYDANGNYVIYKESLGKTVIINPKQAEKILKPKKIMSDISSVSADICSAVAVARNGDLYQISRENDSPIRIMTGVKNASVVQGNTFFAVKKDGTLWSWGENFCEGILGDGMNKSRTEPKQILSNVVMVSGCERGAKALKADGSVWAWGDYKFVNPELVASDIRPWGVDPWEVPRLAPIKILDGVKFIDTNYAIKEDDSLWVWNMVNGDLIVDKPSTIPFKLLDDVVYVSENGAVKKDNTLWLWGSNNHGQFGDGNMLFVEKPVQILDSVIDMAIDDTYAMAVKTDGSVWAWGLLTNRIDEVDDKVGIALFSNKPIKIFDNALNVATAENHSLILSKDNTLWGWGSNEFKELGDSSITFASTPIKIMNDVSAISANYRNSAVIRTDGSLWAWGYIAGDSIRPPEKVSESVSVFTTTLLGWLYAGNDRRLYSKEFVEKEVPVETYLVYDEKKARPVPITLPENLIRITSDGIYKYLLTKNGELYYKENDYAPLEKVMDNIKYMSNSKTPYIVNNDSSLINYGDKTIILTNIAKVESSNRGESVLALSNDGKLYAWGRNDYGIVGNGKQAVIVTPEKFRSGIMTMESGASVIPVEAISTRSVVQIDDKSVVCEVYNINGNNYFKLRDLAMALNGTGKQFEVAWDGTKKAISLLANQPYTAIGDELSLKGKSGSTEAFLAASKVYLGGKQIPLAAYNINGSNYFKLRDIGKSMNFRVSWDISTNNINIDTTIEYTEE